MKTDTACTLEIFSYSLFSAFIFGCVVWIFLQLAKAFAVNFEIIRVVLVVSLAMVVAVYWRNASVRLKDEAMSATALFFFFAAVALVVAASNGF